MAANPAAVAYEAYRQSKNASQDSTAYLIPWEYLPEHEKLAWWAVVRAMIEYKKGGAS